MLTAFGIKSYAGNTSDLDRLWRIPDNGCRYRRIYWKVLFWLFRELNLLLPYPLPCSLAGSFRLDRSHHFRLLDWSGLWIKKLSNRHLTYQVIVVSVVLLDVFIYFDALPFGHDHCMWSHWFREIREQLCRSQISYAVGITKTCGRCLINYPLGFPAPTIAFLF